MNFFKAFPNEKKVPGLKRLPDGRWQMNRVLTMSDGTEVKPDTFPPVATQFTYDASDDELALIKEAGLDPSTFYLTEVGVTSSQTARDSEPWISYTWEQIHPTAETQVGGYKITKDENEGRMLTANWLQFSKNAFVEGVTGSVLAGTPVDSHFRLETVSSEDNGGVRVIMRKYVEADDTFQPVGEDEIDYELNGLKRRTRNLEAKAGVAFVGTVGTTAHPTDTGLILAGLSIRESQATTKVKATYLQPGVVSTSKRLSNNGALEVRSISTWKTVPTTPIGFVLVDVSEQNTEGFPTLEYRFAKGVGVISTTSETKFGGVLTLSTRVELTSASGTAGAISGEYERDSKEDAGYRVWTLRGAVGSGIISDNAQTKLGGVLSVQTVTSVGTPYHVEGEYDFSIEPRDGYTIYTSRGASGSGQSDTHTDVLLSGYVNRVTISSVNKVPTTPVGGVLSSSEITQADGYILYRYTYTVVTSADLPDETTLRHQGKLTLTTKRKINTAPTGAGVLISSRSNPGNGYTIYESVYATGAGEGEIGRDSSNVLDGYVKRWVVSAIGTPVIGPGIETGRETTEADGYTLTRVTSIEVTNADLPDEVAYRHKNNSLTLTTKRKINAAPTSPGGTAALIRSTSNPSNGYTIFESVYASGMGEVDRNVRFGLNGKLVTTTIRSINEEPSAPGGDFEVLTGSSTLQAEGYVLYEFTYVSGTGEVSSVEDTRADGSTVTSKTILNDVSGATTPFGAYQIGTKVVAHDGYLLYTLDYYTMPDDYTVPGVRFVTLPGIMNCTSVGPEVGRMPAVVSITTNIEVTFTKTPTLGSITPITGGCSISENCSYKDGKEPGELHLTSSYGKDYYAGAGTAGSGSYRGRDSKAVFACSVFGAADQLGQEITFTYDATPYFRSGATTIYKQTKETGILAYLT